METMETKREARLQAILTMPEMSVKVLWGSVVERGKGLNWRVHGVHTRFQGPEETVTVLAKGDRFVVTLRCARTGETQDTVCCRKHARELVVGSPRTSAHAADSDLDCDFC